ncbi:MAG: hypothetical protein WD966_03020 [Nitrosopumilaceae archaeon]
MKILYGGTTIKDGKNVISLDNNNLSLPFGRAYNEKPISFLNTIPKQMVNEKKVTHLLEYSNTSLWWFAYPSINITVSTAINFIDRFEKIIDEKKPTLIKVVGEFDKLQLIKQICLKKNIEFNYSKLEYGMFRIIKWIKQKIEPYHFSYVAKKKIKKRINLYKAKNHNIQPLDHKILFLSATVFRRNIYDSEKKQDVRGEYLLENVFKIIKKMNLDAVGIDVDYTFRGQPEVLSERLEEPMSWIPIELFVEKYTHGLNYKNFIRNYLGIIRNHEFKSLFNFNGINFWGMVENDFKKLSYFPFFPTYMELIDSLQKFFSLIKPKAIIITYEKGPFALAVIIACKKCGIKTIGLQHAATIAWHTDYAHRDLQSDGNPLGMPLPDFMLVFGNYAKKILTEVGYPQEKLIVFGNPEFFYIDQILKSLPFQDLKKKYNVPQNKKIIIFTPSLLQRYYKYLGGNYDEIVFEKLLELFANKDEYYVILKPKIHESVKVYENLISKFNCKNFSIIRGNLLELIYMSDLLIAVDSSTLVDAMALNKIVIGVKFGNYITSVPLASSFFTDFNSLSKSIQDVLFDNSLQEKMKEDLQEFNYDQFNIPNEDAFGILKSILESK